MRTGQAAALDAAPPAKRAAALPADERRSMIVQAALPLLLEHGERVTTRQIADAAGIAEGTIFRVFADKDEVIAAVVELALDAGALDRGIAAIDLSLPFEDFLCRAVEIMQQRVVDIWRLSSSIGPRFQEKAQRPIADSDALITLFETNRDRLTVAPMVAARLLRSFTLSTTHPMLVGEPMLPTVIVQLFLYGTCTKEPQC